MIKVSQAKVYDFGVSFVVKQDIVRLDISMDDAELMHVLDAREDLPKELACLVFTELLLYFKVLAERPFRAKLEHDEEVVVFVDDLPEKSSLRTSTRCSDGRPEPVSRSLA